MNDYGALLNLSDRPGEAEEVLKDALQGRTAFYSENNPQSIITMTNYALSLGLQSRLSEAKKWNDRALALTRENKMQDLTS